MRLTATLRLVTPFKLAASVAFATFGPFATACAPPHADAPVAATSEILPLRTLRLYETGVGYFERSGTLGAGAARASTSLPVPPGHLDDALASLVVLQGGAGGMVTGLSFQSSVTKATARSRAGLPPDPATPIAFRDLLGSMKGEKVTIAVDGSGAAAPVVGRVVEVAMEVDDARARLYAPQQKDSTHDEPPQRLVVTLLTGGGAIMRVPAENILRIHPDDPAFARRLDEALDALGTRSTRNARDLHLLGDLRGQVTFGYVTETPIWRASYRLVVGPSADEKTSSAVLQGWALLHNDTDERWHDVHLELVNGEPDSFLFPLAAPRYARRTLVHPTNPLSTLAQLGDTTADAMWGDHLDGGDLGTGIAMDGIGGTGYGSGHGSLSGTSGGAGAVSVEGVVASQLLDVGNLSSLAPASGVEQGALFVYSVPNGIPLEAHASALVPFVERGVAADVVTYFSAADAPGRTAVHFVNSTGQTLPTGTITVFGAGGFTGETSLDRLKPGERRFLQIGNDLDGRVARTKTEQHEESKRLVLDGDTLHEHFLRTSVETLELENRASSERSFYVVLDAERNATVTGADRLDYEEVSAKPVAIFRVKAKEKPVRVLTVVEGLARGFRFDGLTEKSVQALLAKTTIAAPDLAILQQALPRVRGLADAQAALAGETQGSKVAEEALHRLREDLKALGGGGTAGGEAAAAPLVKRLVLAED